MSDWVTRGPITGPRVASRDPWKPGCHALAGTGPLYEVLALASNKGAAGDPWAIELELLEFPDRDLSGIPLGVIP